MNRSVIVTFFMNNINRTTVELQYAVTKKYNKSNHDHLVVDCTGLSHGGAMDWFWRENDVKAEWKYSNVLFLDVDCIPLSPEAIDFYLAIAESGAVVGNIQRSSHIENNQHVFAAPSAVAMSVETYNKIGRPSAEPTPRSDVAEEYTFKAEESGVPVVLYMPLKYDRPPNRFPWEKDTRPFWPLADGMPVYGLGTTFGERNEAGDVELFWHSFQSFHPGSQEKFWERCDVELGK